MESGSVRCRVSSAGPAHATDAGAGLAAAAGDLVWCMDRAWDGESAMPWTRKAGARTEGSGRPRDRGHAQGLPGHGENRAKWKGSRGPATAKGGGARSRPMGLMSEQSPNGDGESVRKSGPCAGRAQIPENAIEHKIRRVRRFRRRTGMSRFSRADPNKTQAVQRVAGAMSGIPRVAASPAKRRAHADIDFLCAIATAIEHKTAHRNPALHDPNADATRCPCAIFRPQSPTLATDRRRPCAT